MYTLNSTEVHAVCYGFDWQEERNIGVGGWYMEETAKTITSTKPGAVLVYDARGNGGGGVCPTITGDHQDRITDYTAIVLATPHPPTVDMPPDLERLEPAAGT